ncbi:MAG: dynamin [Pseudomonadota bacterium]
MEERTDSATPWMAFLIGIIVVALIVVGYFAMNGAPQQTAQLETQPAPQVINVQPPEINVTPPAATSAPADNTAAPPPADNTAPSNTTP